MRASLGSICFQKCLLNEMLQGAHLTAELTESCTGWGQKLPFAVLDLCPAEMWLQDRHMAQFPQSTSQQSAVLGLLEPEVVALCLTALDGFLSSCLFLPLACIYAEEQAQKAIVMSRYKPARRNRKWVSTSEVRMFQTFPFPIPIIILTFNQPLQSTCSLCQAAMRSCQVSFFCLEKHVLLFLFIEDSVTWVLANISCVRESLLYNQRIISL